MLSLCCLPTVCNDFCGSDLLYMYVVTILDNSGFMHLSHEDVVPDLIQLLYSLLNGFGVPIG